MLEELKKEVLKANLDLVKNGLVLFTWGNVSAIDKKFGLVVIKPSGVEYGGMTAEDMVVVDLNGKVVEGKYRPSSDTPTHLELYKAHPEIGGIVHTHSTYATAFAQAGRAIPEYGTTHADYFYGDIPCARSLEISEMEEYEKNTGTVINLTFKDKDVVAIPACLVAHHGVFAWGKDASEAVYHATVVEQVAKMTFITENLTPLTKRLPQHIADKHYNRKHGSNAYYGQGDKK
ncbi:MAG TPA: L-ribulose-5-phosphate 4-epimerase [Clostridiales bacterium]|nr:L-ribulose-5-phosphate 4-epimerase [Clostridiales bacterium]